MSNNPIFEVKGLFNVKNWIVVITSGGTGLMCVCGIAAVTVPRFIRDPVTYVVGRRREALDQAIRVEISRPIGKPMQHLVMPQQIAMTSICADTCSLYIQAMELTLNLITLQATNCNKLRIQILSNTM